MPFKTRPNLGDLIKAAPVHFAGVSLTDAQRKRLDKRAAKLIAGFKAEDDITVELAQMAMDTQGKSTDVTLVFRIVDVGPSWFLPGAPN